MLSIPDAEEVLPSRRNHGLKPSEDPALMIRRCCRYCHKMRKLWNWGRQTNLREVGDG